MVPPVPADDGRPIVRPRSVTVASVLVIIAGALFVLVGAFYLTTIDSQATAYSKGYVSAVKQCNDSSIGGIGTAVATTVATPTAGPTSPLALTALPSVCRQITEPTLSASALSSFKTTSAVFSVLLLVIGLASAASGWFLRDGRRWTRRVLMAVVLIQLILAFLFLTPTSVTLLATLLVVIGLAITFIGRASAFFLVVALRKKQH